MPAPRSQMTPLTRSVVACLASILETDTAEVATPPAGHPEPWTIWRGWLAQRGMGLVPLVDPSAFGWPGPWLAVLRSQQPGGSVCAVAFGVPPGLAWNPLGGPETFDAVEFGYVVAPVDVALWTPLEQASSRTSGRVEALALAPAAEAPMVLVEQAMVRTGRGLEGDRYAAGRGTFSNPNARGHDLTLIEGEALDDLMLPTGRLTHGDARRNVVTRGIDLNGLVGRRFAVGEVECLGQRLCEPCAHLERLTLPGALRGLVHRGGLRADVLSDGVIRLGDPVVAA